MTVTYTNFPEETDSFTNAEEAHKALLGKIHQTSENKLVLIKFSGIACCESCQEFEPVLEHILQYMGDKADINFISTTVKAVIERIGEEEAIKFLKLMKGKDFYVPDLQAYRNKKLEGNLPVFDIIPSLKDGEIEGTLEQMTKKFIETQLAIAAIQESPAIPNYKIFPAENATFETADEARAAFFDMAAEMSKNGPLLIKYHGEQCPGCHEYAPVFNKVVNEVKQMGIEVPMLVVSLDRLKKIFPDTAERRGLIYNLKGNAYFPDLQAFKHGRNGGTLKITDIAERTKPDWLEHTITEATRRFIFTRMDVPLSFELRHLQPQ